MNIIGIDPGTSGAICRINERTVMLCDIPVIVTKRKTGKYDAKGREKVRERSEYNLAECNRLIKAMISGGDMATIYMEEVHVRPARDGRKDSMRSAEQIGRGSMLWEVLAAVHNIKLVPVKPQAWKRMFSLINADKEASRATAIRQFPALGGQLKRKKDHNRAEALLIAEYGRMVSCP